ncbi:hypothetical protein EVAR_2717_1 [Eumeta japonica]|uniref:Uncharacterized protein n=1 Tax=Eumeta variegata TaxID=151549 RepID=A0A4C1SQ54_EUMVA|nr:hypothetical protein EVAR_2717_1 [Eumeta japonica]
MHSSHNDHHVCDLVLDYFGSVNGDALANTVVSRDEVLKIIKQLDENKSPGPNGILAFLVQRILAAPSLPILEDAKVQSLETIRKQIDLIFLHKIVHSTNASFYNSITRMTRLYNDLTADAGAGYVDVFDCRPTAFKQQTIHDVLFQ